MLGDASHSIGERLSRARQDRGMDVTDVSRATRVRATLITAIESDDFAGCGGSFYARGHIRSIARTVGLDPEPLIVEYDQLYGSPMPLLADVAPPARTSAPPKPERMTRTGRRTRPGRGAGADGAATAEDGQGPRRPEPRAPESAGSRRGRPVALAGALRLGGSAGAERALRRPGPRGPNWAAAMAVALVVVIVLAAAVLILPSGSSSRAPLAAGQSSPARASSPRPLATRTAAPPGTLAFAGVSVQVRMLSATSWFRIVNGSGTVLFEGDLTPGTVRVFHATHALSFVIGNAGAVDLVVNGHDLGPAGSPGEVVRPLFTPTSTSLS